MFLFFLIIFFMFLVFLFCMKSQFGDSPSPLNAVPHAFLKLLGVVCVALSTTLFSPYVIDY